MQGLYEQKPKTFFFGGVGPMWGVHREIGECFQNLGWVPCQRSLFEADLRLRRANDLKSPQI